VKIRQYARAVERTSVVSKIAFGIDFP